MIWADPGQTDWLAKVIEQASLRVVGAGSSVVGRSSEVAARLSTPDGSEKVPTLDDLRATLASAEADLVLLASPGDFGDGSHDAEDLAAIEACRSRGGRLFTLEPMPSSVLQRASPRLLQDADRHVAGPGRLGAAGVMLGQGEDAPPAATRAGGGSTGAAGLETHGGWAAFVPHLRLSAPIRDARELIEHFGTAATIGVRCLASPAYGSVGARLFDAVDAVCSLFGEPEAASATHVWPQRVGAAPGGGAATGGLHAAPGERLRGLDGDLSANLRFADGRAGSLLVSNRAGRWSREVTLIGQSGRMVINDDGFVWFGPGGEVVDRKGPSGGDGGGVADAAALTIADVLSRSLDPRTPTPQPSNYRAVLATAEAVLLSARTGEAESPATILRMARGG